MLPGAYLFCRLGEAIVERISDAAHWFGSDRVAAGIQHLAQTPDRNVHAPLVGVDLPAPHSIEQLLATEYAARMLQEISQQPALGGPESISRPERRTRRFSRSSWSSP